MNLRKTQLILSLLLSFSLAFSGCIKKREAPVILSEEGQIKDILKHLVDGLRNKDLQQIEENVAVEPNLQFFSVEEMEEIGWAQLRKKLERLLDKNQPTKLLVDEPKISISSKVAWATGTWQIELAQGNKKKKIAGRATLLLEKREGKWMIVHTHISTPYGITFSTIKDKKSI